MIELELLNVVIWTAVLNGVAVMLTIMSLMAGAATPKLSPAKTNATPD